MAEQDARQVEGEAGKMNGCVYLKPTDDALAKLRDCYVHGRCDPDGPEQGDSIDQSCNCCKERLTLDDPNLARRFVDHLNVLDEEKGAGR